MKKKLLIISIILSAQLSFVSYAGEWKQESDGRWWYQNEDGSFPKEQWMKISGNDYYFDMNGYMLENCLTPDNQLVGPDGGKIIYNNYSYESIFEYYSKKIEFMSVHIVKQLQDDPSQREKIYKIEIGLEPISSSETLAELVNVVTEGNSEMYKLYTGDYSDYKEWSSKLSDIYKNEIEKIISQ